MNVKDILKVLKKSGSLLYASFDAFIEDRALKMSAALAYYTVFAMAPLLIMLIFLASIFYGEDAIHRKLFSEINGLVGNDAALQIQEIIRQITLQKDSTFAVILGVITLFIGATGVFVEMQDSINQIWRVKAKPKKGWKKMLVNRVLSFSMIISLGFLLVASLIINGLILALSDRLSQYFPDMTILVINAFNLGLTFIIISALFGIIFKFLPDVEIGWKDVRIGAFFTATLFILGKFLIGLYIQKVGPGSAYGAAGSIIVILVWVYYTSAILYFGAEFTQVYADCYGGKIRPATYAVHIIQTEEEKVVKVLPPQEHENIEENEKTK
ncbi:YihY/virulence factor BrkB family protein [Daejeonella oryzae]|uniref:YihY/virulence factor BrkB family protein n=1 Tax=Daejeonella oryzae TaxID=1122943 RepID=UPI000400B43E|nr:YihY/virulence factor BrkB family protein [Daejeonella oryzae]